VVRAANFGDFTPGSFLELLNGIGRTCGHTNILTPICLNHFRKSARTPVAAG